MSARIGKGLVVHDPDSDLPSWWTEKRVRRVVIALTIFIFVSFWAFWICFVDLHNKSHEPMTPERFMKR